jgi:hypothetical protein
MRDIVFCLIFSPAAASRLIISFHCFLPFRRTPAAAW